MIDELGDGFGTARFSRRGVLCSAVALGSFGCKSGRRSTTMSTAAGTGSAANGWGLQVATAGSMRPDEKGGTAVVLLHGWGAPGDDLVSLAHDLARPGARFFMPAGPLPETGGGRAWWHLHAADGPKQAFDDEPKPGRQAHGQLTASRQAVQTVLQTIRARHAPDQLVLGGFSQGAMLSLDVALAAEPAVDKVVALSGVMLTDSLAGLRTPRSAKPPVFVSHGRHDAVLPFEGGERIKTMLEKHGFAVTWRPFEGGHEIPRKIVEDLRTFLFG